MILLEKRPQPSQFWSYGAPIVAVVVTMIFGAALFAVLGKPPLEALSKIFWEPLFGEFNFFYLPQLLIKGAPLVAIALGLSLGFKAGIWNIGAEGQYIIGALCGAGVGLALYPMEARWLVLPAMIVAGAFGGFAWAMIPGILRVKFNTNEILVSLMLVYVAEQLLAAMALGAMKNPEGMGFPGSRNLSQYESASSWISQSNGMHWGVVIALFAVIFAYILFAKHILGFQIKLAGQAPRAAAFSGVSPARLVLFCLGISGALAGIAGLTEVSGPAGVVSIDFNVGYGFTAIIVAFLGRLHPVGILMAGALMALTYIGGDVAQSSLGLPKAAIQVFQGTLLFSLLGIDVLTNYRVRMKRGAVA